MMAPEVATILGQRVLLEHTPASTRFQLWSRVSWPARIGLALVVVPGILILGAVSRALLQGGIQNFAGVIVVTSIGAALVVGPYLTRLCLRPTRCKHNSSGRA